MGTTAEKLQAVKASKEAIREALEAKGVQIGDVPFADYATKISEMEVERTSLNLDLKAIYDRYPEEPSRIVVQIKKNEFTDEPITFNHYSNYLLSKVITSDGAVYTTFPATHTWDTSKDIPEDYPYPMQTRWLVICANSKYDNYESGFYYHMKEVRNDVVAMYSDLVYENVEGLESLLFINYGNKQKLNPKVRFLSNEHLIRIPQINTCGRTDFNYMFNNCYHITTIPPIDTSAATSMHRMFEYCESLHFVPYLNTHNAKTVSNMFAYCKLLYRVSELDCSNATTCSYMFFSCTSLKFIGKLLTHNCTDFSDMMNSCRNLEKVEEIDLSLATNINSMFNGCSKLQYIRFKGIIPISLILTYPQLDVDSLMSAINALKDLTGETSKTLSLGTTNLDKLTDEQKAIATAKNWILK